LFFGKDEGHGGLQQSAVRRNSVVTLMVRRRVSAVSNHEAIFETRPDGHSSG
jgi:hypothetical protein